MKRITMVSGRDGLLRIEDEWRQLISRLARPGFLQFYQWYSSALNWLERDPEQARFYLAYDGGQLAGILPVRRTMWQFGRVTLQSLETLEHRTVPRSDMICDGAQAAELLGSFVTHLRRSSQPRWDVLIMPHVVKSSSACQGFFGSRLTLKHAVRSDAWSFPPCANYESPGNTLSKNFQGNLRKARNKLATMGDVQYVSAHAGEDLLRHYDEFIDVEASGWKGGQGTRSAIKLNANICAFYRELAETFAFPGNCEINLLKAGPSCLAGQFCLRVGDTYNILKIGYDETHSAMAPGNVLLERLLQDISTRKTLTRVDLISDMAWHRNWKAAQEDVFTLYLFNRSPRGIGAWSVMQARNMMGGLGRVLRRRAPAPDGQAA